LMRPSLRWPARGGLAASQHNATAKAAKPAKPAGASATAAVGALTGALCCARRFRAPQDDRNPKLFRGVLVARYLR
jgi:hypothetical protein